MDNKIKVSIAILVVLIVAMIFFDYGDVTGKAVAVQSSVSVSPDVISQGANIEINAVPTKNGISKKFYICNDEDLCRFHSTIKACNGYKCVAPFSASYKTGNNRFWDPGVYYLKFYDYSTKDYVRVHFTMIE